LPGLQIYIGCRDELKESIGNQSQVVFSSNLNRNDFGYIKELKFNNIGHPIEDFLEESSIKLSYLKPIKLTAKNKRCVVLTKGLPGVKPMLSSEINKAKIMAKNNGFQAELDTDVQNAGWVIGVECEKLYWSVVNGIKTTLVPTGFGTKFFQKVFPNAEIMR